MYEAEQIVQIKELSESTDFSYRKIARAVGTTHQRVSRTLVKCEIAKVSASDLKKLDPEEILDIRYPNRCQRERGLVLPDWESIHRAMQTKYQTLRKLHAEYRELNKGRAMKYSTFCKKYREFRKSLSLSMKQSFNAGEVLEADFAGKTLKTSFAKKPVHFFVGIHCHSQLIFVKATMRVTAEDWISGIKFCFEKSGGVPEIITPDNPAPVVTRARPNLILNPMFKAFAEHYGVRVIPTRPYRPQDKALVENAVKIFMQQIYLELKKRPFKSLRQLNDFLEAEVDKLNNSKFKRSDYTRQQLFENFDKPALSPLPKTPYAPIEKIFNLKLADNYHFVVDGHSYSAPYKYAHKKIQVQIKKDVVIAIYGVKVIAEHDRSNDARGTTTDPSHMHPDHLWFEDKPIEYYLDWAKEHYTDPSVSDMVRKLYKSKFTRSRLANSRLREFIRISEDYSTDEFEDACRYAMRVGDTNNINSLKTILKSKIYQTDEVEEPVAPVLSSHVRGGDYYSNMGVQL